MSREDRERIVSEAAGDFRQLLRAFFVDPAIGWKRHAIGLLSALHKLARDSSA